MLSVAVAPRAIGARSSTDIGMVIGTPSSTSPGPSSRWSPSTVAGVGNSGGRQPAQQLTGGPGGVRDVRQVAHARAFGLAPAGPGGALPVAVGGGRQGVVGALQPQQ